jgi:hypothetical protein
MLKMSRPAGAISSGRFKAGVMLFGAGWLCPLFIPLVLASSLTPEWQTTVSGALMIGVPEVLSLAAIAILGREGFNELKRKSFSAFKRYAMPKTVGRTRYRFGLVLFVLPAIIGYAVAYAPQLLPVGPEHHLTVQLTADGMFIASLFVLGGEFWDKIRALFVHQATVRFPDE